VLVHASSWVDGRIISLCRHWACVVQAYPSMKPLASWTRDLVMRVEQFEKWATTAHPPMIFWLSAFTFPTGFLTAVLQTSARMNMVRNVMAGKEDNGPFSLP